jgi:hypothetical protein
MSRSKKTIDVKHLVDYVNEWLSNSEVSQDYKEALVDTIDHVLHACNAYRGFKYNNNVDVNSESFISGADTKIVLSNFTNEFGTIYQKFTYGKHYFDRHYFHKK